MLYFLPQICNLNYVGHIRTKRGEIYKLLLALLKVDVLKKVNTLTFSSILYLCKGKVMKCQLLIRHLLCLKSVWLHFLVIFDSLSLSFVLQGKASKRIKLKRKSM